MADDGPSGAVALGYVPWPRGPAAGSDAPGPVPLPEPDPASGALPVDFVGGRAPLFRLTLWTGFLTVVTLGLYRFWMKTRLRRWYWSAVRPGGIPLEYSGLPLEKLLGFLIAVVILAFYIGVVNLVLMFASLSLLASSVAAYAVSLAGVVPLWFFARYRARRYTLARTRWRGIRFGLAPGAWGYALRAMGHWALTILSLGVLWPRMTFGLERYRTDRTVFGSAKLTQGGDWKMLMPHFVHVLIGGGFTLGFALVALGDHPDFGWLLFVSVPWLVYGACHYRAEAIGALARTKRAEGLEFRSAPDPGKVFRIYFFGMIGAGVCFVLPLVLLAIAIAATQEAGLTAPAGAMTAPAAVAGIALYFALFLLWGSLRHTLVLMPLWRHYAETLTLCGTPALAAVEQRGRDGFREAEGFAEALDVGAAI